MLGAVFTSRDAVAGNDRVVVLSHDFWQRHFGRDPAAVGRILALNGEAYTIAGVMPAGFAYPPGSSQPADFWTLWAPRPQDRVRGGSGARSLGGHQSIARLKADVSLDQAQAQMSQVAATIAAANPTTNTGRGDRHSPAARSPRRQLHAVVDAHAPWRCGHRAPHHVCERRESLAGAGLRPATRCGRACGTRRQSRSTRTARADREPRRVGGGDDRRARPCLAGRSRAGGRIARYPRACRHNRHRCARARRRGGRRAGDGTHLRRHLLRCRDPVPCCQPPSPRAPVAAARAAAAVAPVRRSSSPRSRWPSCCSSARRSSSAASSTSCASISASGATTY